MPFKLNEKRTILPYEPSTIETVDYAIYDWLNDKMNIFATTNEGWEKVPVIWVAAERAFQRKNMKKAEIRNGETLTFPLITIERTSVTKDPAQKGMFYGNIDPLKEHSLDHKGGSITIARRINHKKTADFLNADSSRKINNVGNGQINFPSKKKNRKIVYETLTVPMPVYVNIDYAISVKSEYQQQMNEIVQPFMTTTGGINYFIINKDGHKYESFIQQDFSQENNVSSLGTERRSYETTITIKVLGYLIGEGKNQETPKVAIRENKVEIRIPKERTIFGDDPDWKNGKYRS
jgi:hypothetical protein